jgi:hypothetical protein
MLWQVIQRPRWAFRFEHLARSAKQAVARAGIDLRRRKKVLLPRGQKDTGDGSR